MLPVLNVIGNRHNGEAKIVMLNVDKNPKIAEEYGVKKILSVLFFAGGKVVDRLNGVTSAQHLDARIQRLLPVPV